VKLIAPQEIAFTAQVTEDEIRERMALEVLEQIGALDDAGDPLPGIKCAVRRGTSKKAGYIITVTGPAPARLALAAPRGDNA
jgi:hypothetical protein